MPNPSVLARRLAPFLMLAVIVGIFFGRALIAGETFFYDDLPDGFYPWKCLIRQMGQAGHVSLWLPWEFGGYPHLADIQRQLLYPPAWLFLFVDTAPAMVVFIAFHIFLAGALMIVFLRAFEPEADGLSLFCGGLVYAFSAYPVLHSSQLSQLCSYAWLPLLLLAALHAWTRPRPKAILTGAFALAMLVYGGAPQVVYFAACAALALHALLAMERKGDGWKGAALTTLAATLIGLGLAAPQLLPTAELQARSARAAAVTTDDGSAPPSMLATLIDPYIHGNPHTATWKGGYTFHETCFYVGLVTLLIVAAAFGRSRRSWLLALSALLASAIALGSHLPFVHDTLAVLMPGFRMFRVPARFSIFITIAAACLTCIGTQRLAAGWKATATLALGLLAATLLSYAGPWAPALAGAALLASLLTPRWPEVARASLAILLILDLAGGFASRYIISTPAPQPANDFPALKELQARGQSERVVGLADTGVPTQFLTWFPVFGIRGVQGNNPLYLKSYSDYLYMSQTGQMPGAVEPAILQHNGLFEMPSHNAMTGMLDATVWVSSNSQGPAPLQPFGRVPVMLALQLKEVGDGMGLAWSVPGFEVIGDHAARLQRLHEDEFDPRATVILDEDPGVSPSNETVVSLVKTVACTPERIEVDVKVNRASFLVFSELHYPGWVAEIDGAQSRVFGANDVLRAVWVPEGQHRVVWRFVPRSLYWGLGIAALALVACGLLARRR